MRPCELTKSQARYVQSRRQIHDKLLSAISVTQFRMLLDIYATKLTPMDYVVLFCTVCARADSPMYEHILNEIKFGTYYDTLLKNGKFIKAFVDTMVTKQRLLKLAKFAEIWTAIKIKTPDVEKLVFIAKRKKMLDKICWEYLGTEAKV